MRAFVIEYPNGRERRLRLLFEGEVESEGPRSSPEQSFFRAFYQVGAQYKAPRRAPTSEDFGIIKNLLKHDNQETLLEFARLFWRGHAQPVFDNPGTHVFKLFAAVLPDIRRTA